MKIILTLTLTFVVSVNILAQAIIADHTKAKLDPIPASAITQAKANLHIAYGHTSHGSQLITGMNGLIGKSTLNGYKGDIYRWNEGGTSGALDIRDYYENFGDLGIANDLGNPNRTAWEEATRSYLADNTDINVIIWSWCGQAGTATEAQITEYLNLMQGLETDFPNVKFVYMTGHLAGTGETGNLHLRNEQIRTFCKNNNKILFDFADIESYDPDGNYYLNKAADDNCDYDNDGNGSKESNWAIAWQAAHTENVDWYDCSPAHTQALNGNLKAYAAWWLWARLAGWDGGSNSVETGENIVNKQIQSVNYPNPSRGTTKIVFELPEHSNTIIKLFNQTGSEIMQIPLGKLPEGSNEYDLNTEKLSSGLYFYQICSSNQKINRKLVID